MVEGTRGSRTDAAGVGEPEPRQVISEIVQSDGDPYTRLCIGTPTLGTIRMEWHQARISLVMPVNWSELRVMQSLGGFVPLGFLVADAQNLIVKHALDHGAEWLLLYEDDMLPPIDAFIRLNQYMQSKEVPIVSALYTTKSRPPEPLTFRGRGNSYYGDYEVGDLVWCDGVPTGFLLVHTDIMRAMWDDCDPYQVRSAGGVMVETRQMFRFPRDLFQDPETGNYKTIHGTSDLDWCQRVIEGEYIAKAGWPEIQEKEYPLLVDTNIFCQHIAPNGEIFP